MAHPTVPTAAPSFALALLAFFVTNNTQANTVLEQANKAHLEARTWPQPQWPKTEVAQRAFCGNKIFAERRNGKNYAWVLPDIRDKKKQGNVEIMEFFSNKRVRGRIFEYPEGWYNLEHKFLEKNGAWHRRNISLEYEGNRSYAGIEWVNNRSGNGKRIVFFQDDIPKNFSVNDFCSPLLHITSTANEQDGKILLSKVLMHRLFPYKRCPQGRWVSGVSGGMPLGDGTMLVTADQWVFRLNQNDLTPAGHAPALVVLDADEAKAVFNEAGRLKIQDVDEYFSKKFNIPESAYLTTNGKKCYIFNIITEN